MLGSSIFIYLRASIEGADSFEKPLSDFELATQHTSPCIHLVLCEASGLTRTFA